MRHWAFMLMILGGVIFGMGVLLWIASVLGLPLGRLPGDIHLEGKRWSLSFPIVTCLVISVLLTLLLNLFFRR
jgi:hypothetical protein